MPITPSLYADKILTNASVAYRNMNYIAEILAPVMLVDNRTGIYFVYDKSNLRVDNDVRTGKSNTPVVDFGMTKANFGPLTEHALKSGIEKDEMDEFQDPYDPKIDHTNTVTDRMLLNKEYALATVMSSTSIVTQNVTLSGGSQWDDYANSTPIEDIKVAFNTVLQKGAMRPNTFACSWRVWTTLVNHPEIVDRIKYSQLGVTTEQLFAQIIGVKNVVIGDAVYNSANQGQADNLQYVWGLNAWLMFVPPKPALRSIAAFYTLVLKNGRYVDSWVEMDPKVTWVRVNDYYNQKLIAVESIYLINAACSSNA